MTLATSSLDVRRELVDAMQLDLMCADLIALRVERNGIVKKRADQKRCKKCGQKKIEMLWQLLLAKLELPAEGECEGEQQSFDGVRSSKNVDDQVGSLERLKKDRIAASRVGELKSLSEQAARKRTIPERESVGHQAVIKHVKKQISQYEADPPTPYVRCQAVPCCIRERAKATANDPVEDCHPAEPREQQCDAKQKLQDAPKFKKGLLAVAKNASTHFAAEERRVADDLSSIEESNDNWKSCETEAASFETLITAAARISRATNKGDDEIAGSLKTLDEIRKLVRRRRNRISEVYEPILREIFGPAASGRIHVEGNGLQPMLDKKVAPGGAPPSVMISVLACNVSCVAVSIDDVGQHPRCLIHDSPREGEMEGPLLRRLFEIVHELETQFSDPNHVDFHYNVTTTSEPPTHQADADSPYVVETLDATSENGRLLRRKFFK
jgi:hypothetical protein